jgi:glycogen operon protein
MLDEAFLVARGARNLWGYNSIGFFVADARFAAGDPRGEFIDMVNTLHDAGFEVILDVVYNHSAEADEFGPSLCFRGLDNLAWYRMEAGDPGRYVNDTGCGNTLDADQPCVQQLVLQSLAYWHGELGVDGFRFDLATILGRHAHGFAGDHPLLRAITGDPRLAGAKLIAEPWDPGPGGYQLGGFPAPFAELNDRYRNSVRRCWRGDPGQLGELASRMHGSADLFEASGRGPYASINMVTNHDGFTLADVVSYAHKHNQANGEGNRDGEADNHSANHGVEGPSDDPAIIALRRRQRLNLLATLLCSQGTPLLLSGDEFGNSQQGNNNAYAQDNDAGWVDWSGLEQDPGFTALVSGLIALRCRLPLLRWPDHVHDPQQIQWLRPDGAPMQGADWTRGQGLMQRLAGDGQVLLVLLNTRHETLLFSLPQAPLGQGWACVFTSAGPVPAGSCAAMALPGPALAILEAV